jgi:hypothetical protein
VSVSVSAGPPVPDRVASVVNVVLDPFRDMGLPLELLQCGVQTIVLEAVAGALLNARLDATVVLAHSRAPL